jgi:hypothetical protein
MRHILTAAARSRRSEQIDAAAEPGEQRPLPGLADRREPQV